MVYIEDIKKKGSDLLRKLGEDWLANRLSPDTTFNINASEDSDLETTLNYMLWCGWIERPLVINESSSVVSGVKLTPKGQDLAILGLHGKKPEATPEPSKGRRCPY